MSIRPLHSFLAAGVLAACLAPFPAARAARQQQAPAAPPPQEAPERAQQPFKVQVNLINLFVTVRDKHNAILGDLGKSDFRIFEDGQEQKIEFFNKELNLPLTMAILVDTSGSMQRMLPAEQETASRFFSRVITKGDLATIISFDKDSDLLTDFTGSVAELERGLNRARINDAGPMITPGTVPDRNPRGTVFYEAIYLAAREKLSSEVGRKAIIALTDAVDEGSRIKLDEAIEAAQRVDAVVHVLLLSDPAFYFWGGSGAGVAKKIADETGGRMIEVHGEKHLPEAFDQLVQELRSQYVLGYYPSNTTKDGHFRKIKIEVTRPDSKILARKGYYAPKN
ncbi:MAG TPA: VWA domain-containing protein [Candidatus Binatia bacterium]|nr:VWA domain-containing protein [Candidatus Binatia bacterium]